MPKVYNLRDPDCPKEAKYIGRGTIAGNIFLMGIHGDRDQVCDQFEEYVESHVEFKKKIIEYCKGHDLKCYCKPKRCHGDYLLRISNQ